MGFELPISRFEGKWKVSQNRNDHDASAVAEGLRGLGTPAAAVMGELVEMRRPRIVRRYSQVALSEVSDESEEGTASARAFVECVEASGKRDGARIPASPSG